MRTPSLRVRLTAILLVPLFLISAAVGLWQINDARSKATDLFDRNLLSIALAISGDVDASDGEVISNTTRQLLNNSAGGLIYYHMFAPDGAFVIGYATPPVPLASEISKAQSFTFYDAIYRGTQVRSAQWKYEASISGLTGTFTTTVWQDIAVRRAYVRDLALRSFVTMFALIATVALVVWFGVNIGLRPLLDLEDAISRRNSYDLNPIQRSVPPEVEGIVQRLNGLFSQVQSSMEAQSVFISNAAHQLRNPIAGVLAMAEAVKSAPTGAVARARAAELVEAARDTGKLANKMLTLEQVRSQKLEADTDAVDISEILRSAARVHDVEAQSKAVKIKLNLPVSAVFYQTDGVMLREAVVNLLDNALRHGGDRLTLVSLGLTTTQTDHVIEVADNGNGLDPADFARMLGRFEQAKPGSGSGLGLSIADAVAQRQGGKVTLQAKSPGLRVRMVLPI